MPLDRALQIYRKTSENFKFVYEFVKIFFKFNVKKTVKQIKITWELFKKDLFMFESKNAMNSKVCVWHVIQNGT